MLPATIGLIQNTGTNILYAKNKHKFRAISYFCMAILNVSLTFAWVEKFGIVGAAFATCLACILEDGLIMNWYYYKKIEIDIPLFWRNILKMSPLMVVMGAAAWIILNWIQMDTWLEFFVYAVIYTVVYFVLAYSVMMNEYERNTFTDPIRKIAAKLHKS